LLAKRTSPQFSELANWPERYQYILLVFIS
jgi:hypothetical protein